MTTRKEREQLLRKIQNLIQQKYYDPLFNGNNWAGLVETHRQDILNADTKEEFEAATARLFKPLGSGVLGLLNEKSKLSSRNAISASLRYLETVKDGPRWVFQDVAPGGPAAVAAVQPGDAIIAVNGAEILEPRPTFRMSEDSQLTVSRGLEGRLYECVLRTPKAKHKDNPSAEPESVSLSVDGGVGLLKVPLFPGKLGINFAKKLSATLASHSGNIESLIVDLRGNPGGGLGMLRLMSLLTPDKLPIGYSVDRSMAEKGLARESLPRFGSIPATKLEVPLLALRYAWRKSVVLQTEGLGARQFHGKVVVLVNEHTTCAAEMVALFAQENQLATIAGSATPGKLVSHSGFNVGCGYTLVMPIGAYVSWHGTRLDGRGVSPSYPVDWSYRDCLDGRDVQLECAQRFVTTGVGAATTTGNLVV